MIPPVVADDFPLIFVLLMKHFGLFFGAVPSEKKKGIWLINQLRQSIMDTVLFENKKPSNPLNMVHVSKKLMDLEFEGL